MNVLITGATGFLGRNLVEGLLQQPEVTGLVCLVRDREKAQVLLEKAKKPVNLVQGDLLEPATLNAVPPGIEVVIHAAAQVGMTASGADCYPINVEGTGNLLSALGSQSGLKRVVFVSSVMAMDRPPGAKPPYGPLTEASPVTPGTDYGKSKRQAEELVSESGFPYTILRPAFIVGPYARPGLLMDRAIMDVAQRNPYTRFPFTGTISAIYAEDLVELIWKVALSEACINETYVVANPQPILVQDVFKQLWELIHKQYKPYPIPRLLLPWLKRTMSREGLDPITADLLFEDYLLCDPKMLYQHVSFRPYYGFEVGLTKTVQWYRSQKRLPDMSRQPLAPSPHVQPGG